MSSAPRETTAMPPSLRLPFFPNVTYAVLSCDFVSDVKCVSKLLHCVRNSQAVTVAIFINRPWPKFSMWHSVLRHFSAQNGERP